MSFKNIFRELLDLKRLLSLITAPIYKQVTFKFLPRESMSNYLPMKIRM